MKKLIVMRNITATITAGIVLSILFYPVFMLILGLPFWIAHMYWLDSCYKFAKNDLEKTGFKKRFWVAICWLPFIGWIAHLQIYNELYKIGCLDYSGPDDWKKKDGSAFLFLWFVVDGVAWFSIYVVNHSSFNIDVWQFGLLCVMFVASTRLLINHLLTNRLIAKAKMTAAAGIAKDEPTIDRIERVESPKQPIYVKPEPEHKLPEQESKETEFPRHIYGMIGMFVIISGFLVMVSVNTPSMKSAPSSQAAQQQQAEPQPEQIAAKPENTDAIFVQFVQDANRLFTSCEASGDWKSCEAFSSRWLSSYQNDLSAWLFRGAILSRVAKNKESLNAYMTAMKLAPDRKDEIMGYIKIVEKNIRLQEASAKQSQNATSQPKKKERREEEKNKNESLTLSNRGDQNLDQYQPRNRSGVSCEVGQTCALLR